MRIHVLIIALTCTLTAVAQMSFDDFRKKQQADFDKFKKDSQEEYDAFRKRMNDEYAEFMRNAWKAFPAHEADEPVKEKPVPPVVYDEPQPAPTPQPAPQPKTEPKVEPQPKQIPVQPTVVVVPAPAPAPKPVAPVKPKEEVPVKRVSVGYYCRQRFQGLMKGLPCRPSEDQGSERERHSRCMESAVGQQVRRNHQERPGYAQSFRPVRLGIYGDAARGNRETIRQDERSRADASLPDDAIRLQDTLRPNSNEVAYAHSQSVRDIRDEVLHA